MLTSKDTNPKDSIGIEKVPMSMVPSPVVMEIALGMLDGGCKYGPHNYRVAGVRASVYYDAAMRHLTAWWEGEDMDPDCDVLNHVTKALSTLTVLRDSMIQGNWEDDRPVKTPKGFIDSCNKKAKTIMDRAREKFGTLKSRYTEKECQKESLPLTQKRQDWISAADAVHSSYPPATQKDTQSAGDFQSTPTPEKSPYYQKIGKMYVNISKEQLLSSITQSST